MTEIKTTITAILAILAKMCEVKKPQRDFLVHTLILFLSIRSRINFLSLERHSKGVYKENTYRNQFESYFDFAEFNTPIAQEYGSGHFVIGFDPAYRIYDCIVYAHCLKRNIRIAYTVLLNEKGK